MSHKKNILQLHICRVTKVKMGSCLTLVFIVFGLLVYTQTQPQKQCSTDDCIHDEGIMPDDSAGKYISSAPEYIHLSVVACGDRLEEPLVMIKSAVLLSQMNIMLHLFADDELQPQFKEQLENWPENVREQLSYKIYPIQYPDIPGFDAQAWRKLFKPCATQRLFLPNVLTDIDVLLYVDTDVIFMRPIEDVWRHLSRFNASQLAALAPEHESPSAGWYNRFARHPYYEPLGLNSGVMLMNLTRMRAANWVNHMIDYYTEYRLKITWGDQDLINIFFHFHREKLYVYDCSWNYRPDHCMYMSNCKAAEEKGVSVLHGCRQVFHNEKQPAFKVIYQAFLKASFDPMKMWTSFLDVIDTGFKDQEVIKTQCARVQTLLTKKLKKLQKKNKPDKINKM